MVYGEAGLEFSGPAYRQTTREDGGLRIWFDHAEGLQNRGTALEGFEVAGADGHFIPATATVQGRTVVVSSPAGIGASTGPVCLAGLYRRQFVQRRYPTRLDVRGAGSVGASLVVSPAAGSAASRHYGTHSGHSHLTCCWCCWNGPLCDAEMPDEAASAYPREPSAAPCSPP